MQRSSYGLVLLLVAVPFLLGFDTTKSNIPVEEILRGGPPKDGIPALLAPKFVPAGKASYLRDDDRVIGVSSGDVAKAYPLLILNWHEVVNDALGSRPIAVTYCPLTGSAIVYDRRVEGGAPLSFGVSGRLYQSNLLMYDHQTESLWSQMKQEAVTGKRTGTRLVPLPSVITSWGQWRRAHPKTLVLSLRTGYQRDYMRNPYGPYERSDRLMFPVKGADGRLPAKTKVIGLEISGHAKAYALRALARTRRVYDRLGGTKVRIEYDPGSGTVEAREAESGRLLPGVIAYWFAWSAFHPGSALWGADSRLPDQPRGRAEGSQGVAIVNHSARWADVFGLGRGGLMGVGGPGLLVIHGNLRNTSGRALDHVELVFELLDSSGRVVASEVGFNRSGEALRAVESPVPLELLVEDTPVRPIPAGGTDTFRMVFLRDETPPFSTYRIRVVGVVVAGEASSSR